ncbi:hypothetical protein OSTOST_14487, partial [Ostertagia ostertagi]
MAKINSRPIIFALSNPTDKAECTAEDADCCLETNEKLMYLISGNSLVRLWVTLLTTSKYNGKLFKPGQGNNSYIFPGVALSAILFKAKHIPDMAFLLAA